MHVQINGTTKHIASCTNEELQMCLARFQKNDERYKDVLRELNRRPVAKTPEYKPVVMGKVEVKDENGKSRVIDAQVRGYQSFSGGSQQTTSFKKGETCPPSWI